MDKNQIDPMLEPTVRALHALNPRGRELVVMMVRELASQQGVKVPSTSAQGLQQPVEGMPMWIAKLKQERYSPRSIELYKLTVQSYLKLDPTPTQLSIQQWLADRLGQVSSARVANDRKALKSFFGFLYDSGLWHVNPVDGLKSIKVTYQSKDVPEPEDIEKLLKFDFYRKKDNDQFRTLVVLLVTTGLRISEACTLKKGDIDFKRSEIKVMGKGRKEGIVPLLPLTVGMLNDYISKTGNGSQYLFPGNHCGHLGINAFEKALVKVCYHQNIKKLTPHQLRHYFATYALRGGAKLEVVSRILRHASVGITADIYRHVKTDELHETSRQFAPLSQPLLKPGK